MALSYVKTNGDGATTNFAVPFSYLDKAHIHVYVGGVETLTFTWVNSATIQITPAPPVGTLNVEIRRTTPRNVALVDYNNGSVLFDTDLDTANLQSLFIAQEYFEQAESAFPSGHTLDSHSDATPGESVAKGCLRVFDNQSKWRSLLPGTDGQVLESDSLSTLGLSWKQGLRNLLQFAGDLLVATAAGVCARLGIGTNGQVLVVDTAQAAKMKWADPTSVGFTTGDGKLTLKTAADPGWVMANDGTIGSASSGATTRAHADTLALYTLLWDNIPDAWCPVTGGRGISANADFNANKPLALTKNLGRALAIAGAGSGLTSRVLGSYLGSENAVVVQHNHGVTDPGHNHPGITPIPNSGSSPATFYDYRVMGIGDWDAFTYQSVATLPGTTGITIQNAGSSGTGANMQPTSFWNVMIKL